MLQMVPDGPTLVIADGDLPSLLACAAVGEVERSRPAGAAQSAVLLPAQADRAAAARRQAETYGLRVLEAVTGTDAARAPSLMLLNAVSIAAAEGLATVLWPVHAGPALDVGAAERCLDRASLVSRLAALDAGGRPVPQVRAFYADFTDAEIADLALDMDLPIRTCWWYEGGGAEAMAEQARWVRALTGAGWIPPESWRPAATVEAKPATPARAPV